MNNTKLIIIGLVILAILMIGYNLIKGKGEKVILPGDVSNREELIDNQQNEVPTIAPETLRQIETEGIIRQ